LLSGCYDAVPLAKKIVGAIETMLGRASSWNKDKIAAVLKKMKKDVSCTCPSCLPADLENSLLNVS